MKNGAVLAAIDLASNGVKYRHEMLQNALIGQMTKAMTVQAAESRKGFRDLQGSALSMAQVTYSGITDTLSNLEKEVVRAASIDAGGTGSLKEYQSAMMQISATQAVESIHGAIMADVSTIERQYRAFKMQYQGQIHLGVNRDMALTDASRAKVADLKFKLTTKNGRWDSSEWSRLHFRQTALRFYVEAYLVTLIERGIDIAVVDHFDPEHADNGKAFSITGMTKDLPTYDDIANVYFHPNARALVTHR